MKKFGLYKILLAILILAAVYAGYFYFVGRFADINQATTALKTKTELATPPLVATTAKKEFTIYDLPPRPTNPLRDLEGRIYSDSSNSLSNPLIQSMDPQTRY